MKRENIQVKVETFIHTDIIEQVVTVEESIQRTILDIREVQARKALHKLGWYQVKKPRLIDSRGNKLEAKLHKWFDKRFSGRYFNFTLKRRDEYLQSCAQELSKAIKDAIGEWIRKEG